MKFTFAAIGGFLFSPSAIVMADVITEKEPIFRTSSGASVYNTPVSGGTIQVKLGNEGFESDPDDKSIVNELEVDISKLISLSGDTIDIDLGEGEGPLQFLRDRTNQGGDTANNGARRRKLRRAQEIKMDRLEDVVECYLTSNCTDSHYDYLPPNGVFEPEDPTQKFQYFEGKALFQQAEATVYVKSMIHPSGIAGQNGTRYLSGIVLTQRYEYIFRGDPVTGKTFLMQLDPESFPSMPPPLRPEDEMDDGVDVMTSGRRTKTRRELLREEEEVTKLLEAEKKRTRRIGDQGRSLQTDDGSVLDIMVAYTRNAMCQANNQAYPCDDINPAQHLNIINTAEESVARTNEAYINSGINTQLRLVYIHYTSAIDDRSWSCSSILTAFRNSNDGVMDEVHQKRDEWGADFVALLTSTSVSGCGGIAYLGPWSSYMFSVTLARYAVGGTFAHEVGHNYGCEHDRLNANPGKPFQYGWQDPEAQFRTIMAYNCPSKYCPRINYFSNPVKRYLGKIMGNEVNDCARQHNEVRERIALYRRARLTNAPTVSIAPSVSAAPSSAPTKVPTASPTISRSPSSAPSNSIAPSGAPSEYPTFSIGSLDDFQRLRSPGTTAFQVQHGVMFDIEAKGQGVTIHNFRIPFLRASQSVTVSVWVRDGPFWYEKNNPNAWRLMGSPVAYSPGITLEDPVPLPLRGGTEYGFEPIYIAAGTKKGIYILVNETSLEDNLIGMDSRSATSCANGALSPFNFPIWFEDDNLSVSQGIYKESWMTSVGSALNSFNFIGSIYYETAGPPPSTGTLPAPSVKPSGTPSLSLVPSTSLQPSKSPYLEIASPEAITVAAVDGVMFDVYAKDQNIVIRSFKLVIFSVAPEAAENIVPLAVFSHSGSFFDESIGDSFDQAVWLSHGRTQVMASPTLEAVPLPEGSFDPIFVKQGTTVGIFLTIMDPLRNHKILAREGSSLLSKDFENTDVAIKQGASLQWEPCESWGISLTDTTGSPVPHALLGSLLYEKAGTSKPTSAPSTMPSGAPSLSTHPSVSLVPSASPSNSLVPSMTPTSLPSFSLRPSPSPTTTARPTYGSVTLRTPTDAENDGSSAFGLMFDIIAKRPVEIRSFTLSSMQSYPMDIIIYSRKASHYYAYDDESKWETIATFSNFTGGGSDQKVAPKLSLPAQRIAVNTTVAFYIAIVNTYGESWPLLGSVLPGTNYRDGVWASDENIKLMEGVKFYGISEKWPFGMGTSESGIYMLEGPGGVSFNMRDSLIEYRVIDTIMPSMAPSTSFAPTLSQQPSLHPSVSSAPSVSPTESTRPSAMPSSVPSVSSQPSNEPSGKPSASPSLSAMPSLFPSISSMPSSKPSVKPSARPSSSPSEMPSVSSQPSSLPSSSPSDSPSVSKQPTGAPSISLMPTADRVTLISSGAPSQVTAAFGVMFEVVATRAITVQTFHVRHFGSNGNAYNFHVFTKPGSLESSSWNNANVWTKIGTASFKSLSSSATDNPVRLPSQNMNSVTIKAQQTQSFYIACVGNYFRVAAASSGDSSSNGDVSIRAGLRKYPYDTLFQNANQQTYIFEGALVYSYAIESPSSSPSALRSFMPSLSTHPTVKTGAPSTSPSLSSKPSSSPSAKPTTLSPTKDPFAKARIQITIPAKISLSGFRIPQSTVELNTVVTILADSIKAAFALNLNSSQRVKSVRIISINGVLVNSDTTLRSRFLESRNLEVALVDYEILLEEICSTTGCDNSDEVANALYAKATDSMKAEIDNGRFVTLVQQMAAASNVDALLAIAVESNDFSEVVLTVLGALSTFYPDWENQGYCKNDGNEPMYMQIVPENWLVGSRNACCERYFSYAYNECMGNAATTIGWYPAWAHSLSDVKCLKDKDVPNYMRRDPGNWIHADVSGCCKRFYEYAYDECVGASGGSASVPVAKWYPAWANDGEMDVKCIFGFDAPDFMKNKPGDWLYDDISACCERYYSFSLYPCIVSSGGNLTSVTTNKWYVDWANQICVKNCDNYLDSSCGGLAKPWDELFDNSVDCCNKKLNWIPRNKCTLS